MKFNLLSIIRGIFMMALLGACQPAALEPTSTVEPTAVNISFPVFTGTTLEPQGFIQRTHDPLLAHDDEMGKTLAVTCL